MGLSRRFLSLVVDINIPGTKSLSFIDLSRHKLFNAIPGELLLNRNTSESEGTQETTLPAGSPKNGMRMIRVPAPGLNLRSSAMGFDWYMDCFPLAGGNLLCTDQSGRATLFSTDTRWVESMPNLHKPKSVPVSIFVPRADDNDGGGSLFIMERAPGDARPLTSQFEAFTYRRPSLIHSKFWIHSYAVLGGGSHVCISVDRAGTYCLDTVTHTWTQIGDWTLPFFGKVEYVPVLKLWFGIRAKDMQLVAADLSTMVICPRRPHHQVYRLHQARWNNHQVKLHQLMSSMDQLLVAELNSYNKRFTKEDDKDTPRLNQRGELRRTSSARQNCHEETVISLDS